MAKYILIIILAIFLAFVAGLIAFKLYASLLNSQSRFPTGKSSWQSEKMVTGQQNEKLAAGQSSQLANPASVNCVNKGGTLAIMKNGAGAEFGLCNFTDNMSCEEWALYTENCPDNGVKTTGFDTVDQQYCAWLGGQTLAVPNSRCTLPGGKVCSTVALYNGKCPES